MALQSISPLSVVTTENLQLLANSSEPLVQKQIKAIETLFYNVDVTKAMNDLSNVGTLLATAYAGTKNHPSCAKVVDILANYQTLIKNSSAATTMFVGGSLEAIKMHKKAHDKASEKKYSLAIKFIAQCATIAKSMENASEELVKESALLCDQSKEALIAAISDEQVSTNDRKRIHEEINKLKAQEASLQSKITDLGNQVKEEREKEKTAAKKADRAQTYALVTGIISTVLSPITLLGTAAVKLLNPFSNEGTHTQQTSSSIMFNKLLAQIQTRNEELVKIGEEIDLKKIQLEQEKLNGGDQTKIKTIESEIQTLNIKKESRTKLLKECELALQKLQASFEKEQNVYLKREEEAALKRAVIQKEEREANADLKKSVVLLEGLNEGDDELSKSIASLEVAVKTLGKVKTVFENVRLFWKGVEAQCQSLSNIEVLKLLGDDEDDDFSSEIVNAAWNWCVLGQICIKSSSAIAGVDKKVDDIMKNLPSASETKQLIQQAAQQIKLQIELGDNKEG